MKKVSCPPTQAISMALVTLGILFGSLWTQETVAASKKNSETRIAGSAPTSTQSSSERENASGPAIDNTSTASLIENTNEQKTFDLEKLSSFQGQRIVAIRIRGLQRTKENAVRYLLTQRAGDTFDPSLWTEGIHKLYNTGALYHIRSDIRAIGGDGITIDVALQDRWTLVPFGSAQSGGGSFNLGGGLMDTNLFGYFIRGEVGYSIFDSVSTYQIAFSQEYVADTEWMWSADFSVIGNPVSYETNEGEALNTYTWLRTRERVMAGRRFATEKMPLIRLFSQFQTFQDATSTGGGATNLMVESGHQYRIKPYLILGRAQLTNFLEQGAEFTLTPSFTNFFSSKSFKAAASDTGASSATNYASVNASFKQAFIHRNTNFGVFLGGGLMDPAPAPYLFRLGGFDTVRGFATSRGLGRAYINSNLEYRPYLFRFNPPLLKLLTGEWIIQGVAFQDAAVMWNSSSPIDSSRMDSHLYLVSHGIGIRGNILRFANCIGRLDLAHTTIPNEGWGIAMGVGQFF